MPLAGRDLMMAGFSKGPKIGDALKRARFAWLEGGCLEGEVERQRLLELVLDGR
jgi:hypothetical protein